MRAPKTCFALPPPPPQLGRRGLLGAAIAVVAGSVRGQAAASPVRLSLQTPKGAMLLELYPEKSPVTVANFLHYVDRRLYDGATLYRAMKNPGPPPATGLIQGGARANLGRPIPPIAHEPTSKTGLSHTDGTLSLARRAPGTASSDFFICVGDQLYLDADPSAPGDNLGFAAFGRVVEGMDVARAIIALPTSAKAAVPEMVGQMLDPPVPITAIKRIA